MISSARNPKIKVVRDLLVHAKTRREKGVFVIEGVRLAEEALGSGWEAQGVFYTGNLSRRGQQVVQEFAARGVAVEEISAQAMKSISDTETPQGILIVLAMTPLPLPSSLDFILILDGLRDPGNMGTILRTAAAAGVQAVLLSPGSTDAFAPKVLRSGMGAHFRMPIQILSWDDIRALLKPGGKGTDLTVYLADSSGGKRYTQLDFRAPLALIVGGEAEGASVEAVSLSDARVHIPMPGKSESLNAAIAAAILMFEAARQRAA